MTYLTLHFISHLYPYQMISRHLLTILGLAWRAPEIGVFVFRVKFSINYLNFHSIDLHHVVTTSSVHLLSKNPELAGSLVKFFLLVKSRDKTEP